MNRWTNGQTDRRTDEQTNKLLEKKIEREKEKDSNAESGTANKPKKQTSVKYYICYHRQFYQLEAANLFLLN